MLLSQPHFMLVLCISGLAEPSFQEHGGYSEQRGSPSHEVALVIIGTSLAILSTKHPLVGLDVVEFVSNRGGYDELGMRLWGSITSYLDDTIVDAFEIVPNDVVPRRSAEDAPEEEPFLLLAFGGFDTLPRWPALHLLDRRLNQNW